MSFDTDFAAIALKPMYGVFGIDATVTRGTDPAKPLRIILTRGVEHVGEFGQVVGLLDQVSCMRADWVFRQDDLLAWTDEFGAHSKRVESQKSGDSLESVGVLHG